MKRQLIPILLLLMSMLYSVATYSGEGQVIPLTGVELPIWPGVAPGSAGTTVKPAVVERSKNSAHPDRAVIHTIQPILKVFRPEKPNGAAVVIAPGGGYRRVVVDKEGPDTSAWLNSLGVTAFVLYYRMPEDDHLNAEDVPLQDAQRAIRYVRANAAQWGIDVNRVGYAGYSAGGHLGASLAAFYNKQIYTPVDKLDEISAKPNFVILGYPAAGLLGDARATDIDQLKGRDKLFWKYRIEAPISAVPPPTFIFHAEDDPAVNPQHSQRIATALRGAGGSAALHIFRTGGHGFGIRDAKGPVAHWPKLCEYWLRSLGIL